ncbi:MAG: hypothetical protein ACI4F6_07390 [Acutalibacteraceae bacterium]
MSNKFSRSYRFFAQWYKPIDIFFDRWYNIVSWKERIGAAEYEAVFMTASLFAAASDSDT